MGQFACGWAAENHSETVQPNILLILLDDFGVADLGYAPQGVSLTPNLDQLAAEGLRFSHHYVDSTCQATRAGILTGRYPASMGFRPSGPGIEPSLTTLPEALRAAGYATHHVGKWHLGFVSQLAWPLQQGFDSFYGFLNQFLLRGPHTPERTKIARPTYLNPWLQAGNGPPQQTFGHLSDLLLEQALSLISAKKTADKPWFINYWMYLPHAPLQPAARYAADEASNDVGRYRGMLRQADWVIGELLQALDRAGLAESTLVLVASDNGGTGRQLASNAPFQGEKTSYGEGGIRTPLIVRGPTDLGAPGAVERPVSYLDYMPTLLAQAGAAVPEGLPGKNFLKRPDSADPEPPTLLWESHNSESAAWAVLEQSSGMKLHRYFIGAPVLNDLTKDPTGLTDSYRGGADDVTRLADVFRSWRHLQRQVDVPQSQPGDSLPRIIPGGSFLRAPGFGGFTWIMGVKAARMTDSQEVLVDHPGYWKLQRRNRGMQLDFLGARVDLPSLPIGRCVQLAITDHHAHNLYRPDTSWSSLEVYLDGELVAERRETQPSLPPDAYESDIYIGANAAHEQVFRGELGEVLLLNERLLAQDEADPWLANGIAGAPHSACAKDS